MGNIETKLKIGLIWSLLGKFGNFFITFISNIILVRLLAPEDFGIIAIVLFFTLIATVLSEGGMAGALIRKDSVTEKDYSTLFIFNFIVSVFVYLLLFCTAPFIAYFYEKPNLLLILQVMSLVVIINALRIVQTTRLYREISYKEVNIYQFISICIASVIAIFIAYRGYGVWALVAQQLIISIVFTMILWVKGKGVESFRFSRRSFLDIYQFGIYTTLASLLNTIFDNIYQLILGKNFSLSQSGYYYQGKKIQELPLEFLKSITLGVVFSALSRLQDEKKAFDKLYNKIHILFSLLIGLITVLLLAFPKEILLLLFGEKWLGSAIYIQLLSIASFFYMQEMLNRVLFKVFNQAKKIFQLELFKKIIQAITIVIGVYFSDIFILLCGLVFSNLFGYLLNIIVIKSFYQSSKGKWHELYISLYIAFVVGFVFVVYEFLLKNELSFEYINLYYFPVLVLLFFILSMSAKSIRSVVLETVRRKV
ncbi:oligosaccharide flippase family protein [Acinetobacter haemolyticus]|uniref:lipopolysaccharide biosynthesis protein n=1 Tax=Acinetobacter haemolyticus TaxID=29430 RepID=UPI0013728D38|nr:lipopolysaccharide biosynthesis protein [Acinetobacter haemolyticus]NAR19383.1 oligosaccharide flippase family protein [Acinetobacter haemolyticus]